MGPQTKNKNNSVNTCLDGIWSKGTKRTWNTKTKQRQVKRKEQDEEWDLALEIQGMICDVRGVKWKETNESKMQGSRAWGEKTQDAHMMYRIDMNQESLEYEL